MSIESRHNINKYVFLYAERADINEATSAYIATIEKSLVGLERKLLHVERVMDVPAGADVLVIDCKHAAILQALRPSCRYWLWLQGIVPEELELQMGSKVRKAYWTLFERRSIPRAQGVFMVSNAMQDHYAQKYHFTGLNTLIMPCSNQKLHPPSFGVPQKYVNPRFIYAGSLARWQCVDETLKAYALIKEHIPSASLTIFTRDRVGAMQAIERCHADDVNVDYCALSELQTAFAEFKYGFVLRKPDQINKVSTPTKVSSYMAAGVIPILTTAVADYVSRLSAINPIVMINAVDPESVLDGVLKIEGQALDPDSVLEAYSKVFDLYLDHDQYISRIEAFFRDTGIKTDDKPKSCDVPLENPSY